MSGSTVTATSTTTCPDANSTPTSSPPVSQPIGDPIVDGKSATVRGTDQAYCTVEENGVPVGTILPASVSISITGTGTDINGTLLQAPSENLPVTW